MARKKIILSQVLKQGVRRIKVQLDQRTVITLNNMKSLAFWKQRYPQARIIG